MVFLSEESVAKRVSEFFLLSYETHLTKNKNPHASWVISLRMYWYFLSSTQKSAKVKNANMPSNDSGCKIRFFIFGKFQASTQDISVLFWIGMFLVEKNIAPHTRRFLLHSVWLLSRTRAEVLGEVLADWCEVLGEFLAKVCPQLHGEVLGEVLGWSFWWSCWWSFCRIASFGARELRFT